MGLIERLEKASAHPHRFSIAPELLVLATPTIPDRSNCLGLAASANHPIPHVGKDNVSPQSTVVAIERVLCIAPLTA